MRLFVKKLSSISIGARDSPLSRAQVTEVLQELTEWERFYKSLTRLRFLPSPQGAIKIFRLPYVTLPPGDFFTKELDEALLAGTIDAAIHSAKDLPPFLPEGLELIALTQGKTAQDALVLRKEMTLETLPPGACIATSSFRREEAVRTVRSDLTFRDIRGPIDQRLEQLRNGTFDGLVVAACALERLGIHDVTTYVLSGPTARYQGRLAIVGRKNDECVKAYFSSINTKKTLFFGLEAKPGTLHVPLIKTVPHSH